MLKNQKGSIFATVMAVVIIGFFAALLLYSIFIPEKSFFNMIFNKKKFEYKKQEDLAYPYYFGGFFEKAMPKLEKLIEMNQEKEMPHFMLGVTYARLGHADKAVKELQTALRLKPDFHEAAASLASIYMRYGMDSADILDYQKALDYFRMAEKQIEQALLKFPDSEGYLNIQKQILAEAGKLANKEIETPDLE